MNTNGNEERMILEITIILNKDGHAEFEFYEPESGDFSSIDVDADSPESAAERLGGELISWLPLMADALEDNGSEE